MEGESRTTSRYRSPNSSQRDRERISRPQHTSSLDVKWMKNDLKTNCLSQIVSPFVFRRNVVTTFTCRVDFGCNTSFMAALEIRSPQNTFPTWFADSWSYAQTCRIWKTFFEVVSRKTQKTGLPQNHKSKSVAKQGSLKTHSASFNSSLTIGYS